jgi:Pvc16 N-terminal domain
MAVVIDVPSNTTLADVDEALRALVRRELEGHGIEGVDISFDAPSSEWSAKLTAPTVNLFLYDLREHAQQADTTPRDTHVQGTVLTLPPPLRLEMTYAVTAWAKAVEDEHRLLSQTLAVLLAHTRLPDRVLGDRLAETTAAEGPITSRIGQPKGDHKAEFWTAVGGRYRVSLDYVVTISIVPGVTVERGPEVRTRTVRVADLRAGARSAFERHRTGGIVRSADGRPVADAWLVLPAVGAWASSGPDGRFAFDGVPAGTHRCECRTPGGMVGAADLVVPGGGLELTIESS